MTSNPKPAQVEIDATLIHPDCARSLTTNQTTTNTLDNNKTNLKDGIGFLLDVIIVRLDIQNKTVEDQNKLLVYTNFNENNFTITSSRINVLDFKHERSIELKAKPLDLKEALSKNPLRLKVTDGDNVLGYGSIKWPDEFLLQLVECKGEMTNSFETELKECDGTKTGTIQLIVRLQPKCEEYVEDDTPDGKCRNANKEINANDVLFVVGEDENPCCCSQIGIIPASDSDHDLQPKCLDLSSFRAVNSQNIKDTDILASLDPACQKLKTVSNHYQKLIDAVKSNKKTKPSIEKFNNNHNDFFCTLPRDVLQLSTDSYHQMPLNCLSEIGDFAAKNFTQSAYLESPPVLMENEPESCRCCPLCKANMEYLPKLAACPNCCYKTVPHFEEKPYNDTQNSEQIIKEFQDKLQTNSDTNLNEPPKCRCTCKYGSNKPCAHCRIRKLCENIFQPSPAELIPKHECEPKSSDVICSSSDNRPFLTKIFSELKDLYDIEEPKKKQFAIDVRCERELNKDSRNTKHLALRRETNDGVQKQETEEANKISRPRKCRTRRKRSFKPASKLAVKSRLFDYQLVRQHFPTQIGHKTCINGFAGRKNVPPNMGWLWNVHNSAKWKPGSIRKPIKELMRYFLKDFPADSLLVSQYSYRKRPKLGYTNNTHLVQKPTLHIHKKNGEYIITMRPLKPFELLRDAADPYENMKPIQFRIVKNPHLETLRNLKKYLKKMGFRKCTCHRPIMYCYCRSFLDKKKLEYQCNKECCKREMAPCCDTLVLSDTSDSEAEFNFGVTPPVGVIKPERLRKINLVNVGTQYNELDWNPMPLFPKPPNKYMQMYQCAMGERKAKSVVNGNGEGTKMKTAVSGLRNGSCVKGTSGASYGRNTGNFVRGLERGIAGGKGLANSVVGVKGNIYKSMGSGFAGGRGGGDGLVTGKEAVKGGAVAINLSGKYGGRADPALKISKKIGENIPKKKVDMLKYTMKVEKQMAKMSSAEAAAKRKEKINLLKGVNPPLLCMIDRLGKPVDTCTPCNLCDDSRIC